MYGTAVKGIIHTQSMQMIRLHSILRNKFLPALPLHPTLFQTLKLCKGEYRSNPEILFLFRKILRICHRTSVIYKNILHDRCPGLPYPHAWDPALGQCSVERPFNLLKSAKNLWVLFVQFYVLLCPFLSSVRGYLVIFHFWCLCRFC